MSRIENTKYNQNYYGLFDNRNKKLWLELNKTHQISIEFEDDRTEYRCFLKDKMAIIYVPTEKTKILIKTTSPLIKRENCFIVLKN